AVGPDHEVAAIVSGKVDAVGVVVGGNDQTAAVKNAIFAEVLLVDAQHIGRGSRIGFRVVVERISIDIAEVAGFVDPEDDGLGEAIKTPEEVARRHFNEIPRSDSALDGVENRVLADPLIPTEDQAVIDLDMRALHPVGKPLDDMIGITTENPAGMVKPATS